MIYTTLWKWEWRWEILEARPDSEAADYKWPIPIRTQAAQMQIQLFLMSNSYQAPRKNTPVLFMYVACWASGYVKPKTGKRSWKPTSARALMP